MSQGPKREKSFRLPRLSRTSVFMPTVIPAAENPGWRKRSEDVADISPLTSQVRLSTGLPVKGFKEEEEEEEEEEDGDVTPMALDLGPREDITAPQAQRSQRDGSPESERSNRNDSTSTSATGPAGSGMPPAETAFLCEKEVVDGVDQRNNRDDNDEDEDVLEIPLQDARPKKTFLNIPPENSPRHVQSPRLQSNASRLASLDATSMVVNGTASTALRLALLGKKADSSSSSLDTAGSPRSLPEDDADILFKTAQKAQLKRPSLVNHPGTSSSSLQARTKSDGNDPPILGRLIPRSKSVATGSATKEASALLSLPGVISGARGVEIAADLLLPEDGPGCGPYEPPNTLAASSAEEVQKSSQPLTLLDALSINPTGASTIPKRSITVPASVGARRKTRFTLLPLSSNPSGTFRREDIVTTPYPTTGQQSESRGLKERLNVRTGSRGIGEDPEKGSSRFSLVVSARNRTSTTSFSPFDEASAGRKYWSESKRNDDEHLFRTARREYANLIGRTRHAVGAKTAKAVRLRFVRSNKIDLLAEPDTPTVDGRLGSYAESDCWRLWSDPSHGKKKHEWLDMLAQNTKTYGASRHYVFEIKEGYDATRVIIAVSVITALSLVAMFLWLFLGAGGEGNTLTIVDGTALQPPDSASDSAGRAGDAFIFSIWVLFIGWSVVGGWILAS